jgi:hypothetical protein
VVRRARDSPRSDEQDLIYKTERRTDPLNLAEKMGEMSHTPDNVGAYKNPFNESAVDPSPGRGTPRARSGG